MRPGSFQRLSCLSAPESSHPSDPDTCLEPHGLQEAKNPVDRHLLLLTHSSIVRRQKHHCENNALAEVSVQRESEGSRQGRLLRLTRFSKIARLDGDFRTSFRSNRPYCTHSTVAEGLLLLTRLLLFHYIARREALEASASELFNVVASGKVRMNVD